MQLQGKIKLIKDVQEFDSGFKKVEFVLTTNEQYPQDVKFEVLKEEGVERFLQYNKVGDYVNVSFNIRGNEYNGNYYVNLQSWRVEKLEGANSVSNSNIDPLNNDTDELPF